MSALVLGTELNPPLKLLKLFTSVGTQLCLRLLCVLILIKIERKQNYRAGKMWKYFSVALVTSWMDQNGAAVLT